MRISGIKIGKLFGIEIFLDYSWFFIFALMTWALSTEYFPSLNQAVSLTNNIILGALTALFLFASALIHELLHSLTAKRNGLEVNRITLFLFGGIAELFEEPKNAKSEFKIALAGPLTSFILAGIFWVIFLLTKSHNGLFNITVIASALAQINFLLGAFNLLPGFPLDGGRILRSIAWHYTKNLKRATQIASDSGKTIAVIVVIFGVIRIIATDTFTGTWLILIGLFLYQAAGQGYMELLIRFALEDIEIKELMNKNVLSISPYLSINELIEEYFLKLNCDTLPVIKDDKVVGIISLLEIRKKSAELTEDSRVYEVMKAFKPNIYLKEKDRAIEALKLMVSHNINFISIVDGDRLAGILTVDDIAKYLANKKII